MSAVPTIISVHNLHKVYLERVILEDVTFSIHEGERVAFLGANGAGKSTLLGIIAGVVHAEDGDVRMRRDLRIAYLDQSGGLTDSWTVQQTINSAFDEMHRLERELDDIHRRLEEDPHGPEAERLTVLQGEIGDELHRHDYHALHARMSEAMAALGVPPGDRIIGELSGGEQRRTALCRTLLQGADLLLLDEPTNHLDAETLDWLEDFLNAFRGTVLFVTHDRYFLDNVATKMVEISRGRALVYQGNYTDYLAAKQIEDELAARNESTRQNLLRRELEWLRRQPKARTTKAKARIDRAHDLIASKPIPADGSVQMLFPTGPRLGNTVVELEAVTHSIGGRCLIDKFTFILGAGDRVGIVGRNGLGKTTLLSIMMKTLEPDSGKVKHGQSVRFVYADQARKSLDPDKTVLQEVAGDLEFVAIGDQRISFRSWLARFLFDENTAAMPVRLLSGGERNRVQLAKMLREGGNIIVLDEPTNDLDLPTLRVVEESLANFTGCALIVSHDRYFLNRVANRVIGFRGDGRLVVVEGNYDNYRGHLALEEAAATAEAAVAKAEVSIQKAKQDGRRKLTFNEQREFEAMEETILATEEKLAQVNARMEAPDTFVKGSREEINALVQEADRLKAEVERLYARWAELGARA